MLLSAAWLSTTTSQIDSDKNSASCPKCTPHCEMSFVMIIFHFAWLWITSLLGYLRWRQFSLQGTIRSCDLCVFLSLESHFFYVAQSLCMCWVCAHMCMLMWGYMRVMCVKARVLLLLWFLSCFSLSFFNQSFSLARISKWVKSVIRRDL